jgi:hypothetical protein
MDVGSYRYHRAHTLLALVTADQADNCTELKDYASNYASSLHSIALDRSTSKCHLESLSFVSVARNAPYRKLAVGVLPLYRSNEAESYHQLFINIIKEVQPIPCRFAQALMIFLFSSITQPKVIIICRIKPSLV